MRERKEEVWMGCMEEGDGSRMGAREGSERQWVICERRAGEMAGNPSSRTKTRLVEHFVRIRSESIILHPNLHSDTGYRGSLVVGMRFQTG
jgi:hypothetical protein